MSYEQKTCKYPINYDDIVIKTLGGKPQKITSLKSFYY